MPDEPLGIDGLDELDKLLEHRVRLAICVLLSRSDAMTFSRFKTLLEETDGNLGANLRRLEEAGYISVDKRFEDRKPVSWYSLTMDGRAALKKHVEALEALLADAAMENNQGGSPS